MKIFPIIIASVPLMKRLAEEIYRKLRNTFRFLLGNLEGFNPAKDEIQWEQMQPLDQYMLARCAEAVTKVRRSYDAFEFHRAYHALNEFCNAELSAFYLDVLKDRLYTFAPKSTERLSAQTAIWKITEALVRLIAPILSFTADEVWQHLPHVEGREASVHIAHFPEPKDLAPGDTSTLLKDWEYLLSIRTIAMKSLEEQRQQGNIGKGLEARLVFTASLEAGGPILKKYFDALPELFNVSKVEVESINIAPPIEQVRAEPASGIRCNRCWRYTNDVGNDTRWPETCLRCVAALDAIGTTPAEFAVTTPQEQKA